MKHMELDLHFVQEKVISHQLEVRHITSKAQIANILTKPIARNIFAMLRNKLNVEVLHPEFEGGY